MNGRVGQYYKKLMEMKEKMLANTDDTMEVARLKHAIKLRDDYLKSRKSGKITHYDRFMLSITED